MSKVTNNESSGDAQKDMERKYVIGFVNPKSSDMLHNDYVYTLDEAKQEIEASGEPNKLIIFEITPAYKVKYTMEKIIRV